MQCQGRPQKSPLTLELLEKEARLNSNYKRLNETRYQYLSQKNKVQWLKIGDRNTKFFHNMIKARRNMNRVFSITNSQGAKVTKMDAIAKDFIEFYTILLGTNIMEREHINSSLVRKGPIATETQRRLLE